MTQRAEEARPESERIALLLRRDGHDAARAWVQRTVRIYETALAQPHSLANDPAYRALYERAVEEFCAWLRADAPGSRPG